MRGDHFNEPIRVGYDKDNHELYSEKNNKNKTSWTSKESSTIFAGVTQAELFLFALAVGKNKGNTVPFKKIEKNIPLTAFKEDQKWQVLSSIIAKGKNLIQLKDEKAIYSIAEEYANEGINILKSHMEMSGPNYPKMLEAELRDILKK